MELLSLLELLLEDEASDESLDDEDSLAVDVAVEEADPLPEDAPVAVAVLADPVPVVAVAVAAEPVLLHADTNDDWRLCSAEALLACRLEKAATWAVPVAVTADSADWSSLSRLATADW